MDKNAVALDKSFRLIDFADINKDIEVIQSCTENIDNLLRKKNLHVRGLQENIERTDGLKSY